MNLRLFSVIPHPELVEGLGGNPARGCPPEDCGHYVWRTEQSVWTGQDIAPLEDAYVCRSGSGCRSQPRNRRCRDHPRPRHCGCADDHSGSSLAAAARAVFKISVSALHLRRQSGITRHRPAAGERTDRGPGRPVPGDRHGSRSVGPRTGTPRRALPRACRAAHRQTDLRQRLAVRAGRKNRRADPSRLEVSRWRNSRHCRNAVSADRQANGTNRGIGRQSVSLACDGG